MPFLSQSIHDTLSFRLEPWNRSFQFWFRVADIYSGYKMCQLRTRFIKDDVAREVLWEKQHEIAAEKIFSMCYDLGGLFLKGAQLIGKPDLAPSAWVKKLVTLCDNAPATPFSIVKLTLEEELGQRFDLIFDTFDPHPVGSASIAQVHRARLRGATNDVAVKVQHPGVRRLMMTDINNMQAFVLFLQKTDIKADLFSMTKEMEKQIGYEFDFLREADAMKRIRKFVYAANKKPPVLIPREISGMTTRRVLVMDFIEGIPILNLEIEMVMRGINPSGKISDAAKKNILKNLTNAYGQMILKSGFFHADPHPGNILICKNSEVALLDYGQVKHLPEYLRLGYANLVLAMADNDPLRAVQSYKDLGIETSSTCADESKELLQLARSMFDTKLPPGVTILSPFAEDSSLQKVSVPSFPEELFSVLRTMQLLRGLSVGMGVNYSCAEQWRPIAEETLHKAGKLKDFELRSRKQGVLRKKLGR
ncbi:ABC1 protein kinase [Zostera marina]|uniref:ABC1 protein kinase n=1 Tax=Zostera marina TaxID=29655 RepID=A0A0K9NYU7_ZOSMR|nr:ABC1 protein kinase [Zostera marina]